MSGSFSDVSIDILGYIRCFLTFIVSLGNSYLNFSGFTFTIFTFFVGVLLIFLSIELFRYFLDVHNQ